MKVVVLASEAVPFSKTGGLADVAGALPLALDALGQTTTLIIPLHRGSHKSGVPLRHSGFTVLVPIGLKMVEANLIEAELPGSKTRVILIDQPVYFDRSGLYGQDGQDFTDNSERFTFFSKAAIEAVRVLDLNPDVIHCNDWQTGLVPAYLREFYPHTPGLQAARTLFTIHNLAYQGVFGSQDLPVVGLDWRFFNHHQLEFHGKLNFLKAGVVFADRISTVSPSYAREIQTPQFGCGLDGLLRSRSKDLSGIVNGIDTRIWNPKVDTQIATHYDSTTFESGKAACKSHLQRRLNLPERPEVPLFAQIGRLDPQKGWDLLAEVSEDLLAQDVQMVVLGTGRPQYQKLLDTLSNRYAGKVRFVMEFSPQLAHQIEAGADIFLMPSLYEPCGLNQLYSLAYGTVPIVRATGGLADTVVDAVPTSLREGTATGFTFRDASHDSFWQAILRALTLWSDRPAWRKLVETGMRRDWSWGSIARSYVALYESMKVPSGR